MFQDHAVSNFCHVEFPCSTREPQSVDPDDLNNPPVPETLITPIFLVNSLTKAVKKSLICRRLWMTGCYRCNLNKGGCWWLLWRKVLRHGREGMLKRQRQRQDHLLGWMKKLYGSTETTFLPAKEALLLKNKENTSITMTNIWTTSCWMCQSTCLCKGWAQHDSTQFLWLDEQQSFHIQSPTPFLLKGDIFKNSCLLASPPC